MNNNILGDKKKSTFDDNLADYVNKIYDKMPDDFLPSEKNLEVASSKKVFSDYNVSDGTFVEQMPLLIKKNLVPVSFYDLMLKRVSVLGSKDEDFWWDNSFFSGDCVVYHPDGRFKIVLDSEHLRTVNSSTELVNGALILKDGVYESLQGPEFSNDYRKHSGKLLTEERAKKDPSWFALARSNQELLDAYVSATFKKTKDRCGTNTTAMGVYLSNTSEKTFLRPWWLAVLDSSYGSSSAFGSSHLNYFDGRVVGVAPEAQ